MRGNKIASLQQLFLASPSTYLCQRVTILLPLSHLCSNSLLHFFHFLAYCVKHHTTMCQWNCGNTHCTFVRQSTMLNKYIHIRTCRICYLRFCLIYGFQRRKKIFVFHNFFYFSFFREKLRAKNEKSNFFIFCLIFAIFDDFLKFCNVFSTINFEKWQKMEVFKIVTSQKLKFSAIFG